MFQKHPSATGTDGDLEVINISAKAMESQTDSDDGLERIWTPEEETAVV